MENAELIVQLASAKRNFIPEKIPAVEQIKPQPQQRDLSIPYRYTNTRVGPETLGKLNTEAEKAIVTAQETNNFTSLHRFFEEVVQEPLRRMLRRRFGVEGDKFDDITQIMWEKVLKNAKNFTFRDSPPIPLSAQLSSWFNTIAVHTAIDEHRVAKPNRFISLDKTRSDDDDRSFQEYNDIDDTPSIEEQIISNLDKQNIRTAILNLTEEDQRRIIIMKYVLGYSTRDIAYVLDKKEGAIRAQLMRGLHSLQLSV